MTARILSNVAAIPQRGASLRFRKMSRPCALGHVYGMMGDFRHAVPPLERGIALSREWNPQFAASTLMEMLCYVHALSGRISEGLELLEQALTLGETVGFKMYLTPTIIHLGEVQLLANQQEKARSLANRALGLASEH